MIERVTLVGGPRDGDVMPVAAGQRTIEIASLIRRPMMIRPDGEDPKPLDIQHVVYRRVDDAPRQFACDWRTFVPETIRIPMERCPDFLDFPTAWAIQHDRGSLLDHHERCSSVPGWDPISGPGLLCDCGAVVREWERLKATAPGV